MARFRQGLQEFIISGNAGFYAGDAFATGWLERKDGKWLQSEAKPATTFRRAILPVIAGAAVKPKGYKGQGPFKM